MSLGVQLLVMPENTVLVEGNAPVAFEIGLDLRPRGDGGTGTRRRRARRLARFDRRSEVSSPCKNSNSLRTRSNSSKRSMGRLWDLHTVDRQ